MLDIIIWNVKDVIGISITGLVIVVGLVLFTVSWIRFKKEERQKRIQAQTHEEQEVKYTLGKCTISTEWLSAEEYQPTTINGKSEPVWALCDNNDIPKVCIYHSNKRWYEAEKGKFASVQVWAKIVKPLVDLSKYDVLREAKTKAEKIAEAEYKVNQAKAELEALKSEASTSKYFPLVAMFKRKSKNYGKN